MLSLLLQSAHTLCYHWCRSLGSNQGHRDFQSLALPTELPRQASNTQGSTASFWLLFMASVLGAWTQASLWYHEQGSNLRPAGYESATLPTELSWYIGAFDQIRTDDPFLTMEVLYLLSYEGIK